MDAHIATMLTFLAACIKFLLIPSYHSTDFEVHRNWLAITYNLPLSRWYFEEEYSIWTLDYPPLFAYFEFLLSQFAAACCDRGMLQVSNPNYFNDETLYFQRISVVVCDLILCYSTYKYINANPQIRGSYVKVIALFGFIVFNAGLILVDNVHFQYNGYLLGLLVYCFYLSKIKSFLALAGVFSLLVLSKHLFAPLSLPVGIYLIRSYCYPDAKNTVEESSKLTDRILRFSHLVVIALSFLLAAFGPFILASNPSEQLSMIFSRLFPFGRGLVHAYWAPNFWAIYSAADRMLLFVMKFAKNVLGVVASTLWTTGDILSDRQQMSLTTGLVGDVAMSVLPNINAPVALALVVLAMFPALLRLWSNPNHSLFLRAVVNCTLCMFVFGYHVHEKAILVTLIPLSLISFDSSLAASLFLQTSVVGIFSLFPLFTGLAELPIKSTALISYTMVVKTFLCSDNGGPIDIKSYYITKLFPVTLYILCSIFAYSEILFPALSYIRTAIPFLWIQHKILLLERFQFLPLMLVSVTCAISTLGSWIMSYSLLYEEELLSEDTVHDESAANMTRNVSVDEFSFLSDHLQDGDPIRSEVVIPSTSLGSDIGGILKAETKPRKSGRRVRFSSF